MPNLNDDIKDTLNLWIETVGAANGDADKVLPLYAKDAVLLATFSDRVRCNSEDDLRGYFKYFSGIPGLQGKLDEVHIHACDHGLFASASGFYTFTHNGTPDGSQATAPARFTFTYRKEGDKWMIVQHHSSVMPEEKADKK